MNIDLQHAQEFQASAIADDIVALNFHSFDGNNGNEVEEVFTLLIEEPKHNNNGTLSGKPQNDLANTLRGGGWIYEGYRGMCVKPDTPRKDKDGKVIKYESPRGQGSLQLFIPHVSVRVADAIAVKHGLTIPHGGRSANERAELLSPEALDSGFWDWFLTTELPLIITEGAKKACSLVSAGYPAIALNGIWGWGTNVKDMFGDVEKDERGKSAKTLHPDLEPFLKKKELVLAFDRDDKTETVRMVESAKSRFVDEIAGDGITVTQITWKKGKGIDDYIVARGVKNLDTIYTNRKEVKPPKPAKEKAKQTQFITSIELGLQRVTYSEGEGGKETDSTEPIGNHLEAISYCESLDGTGAGILIEFRTQRGKVHRVLVPRGTLTGDGSEALRFLADRGYHWHRKQKQLLLDYLFGLGCEVVRVYTIADKTGWVNGSFLTPAKTYGDPDLRFREPEPDNSLTEIKGTLEGWINEVAAKCKGNSRLIFSLGVAFAAPLLEPTQIESGGFHLVGTTSIGKTTVLSVAAGVAGLKNIPTWNSTYNAVEGKAAEFNHMNLPIDEIGQADPQTVANSAYMLGNGQGKDRSTRTLTNAKRKTWQLLFLSTGEVSMTDYLRQAKILAKGGMEARMPSIPADAGKGYGVFENIHGYDTPKKFVDALETCIRKHQGTALEEYLTQLIETRKTEGFDKELRERVHSIASKLSQQFNDTAIGRVAVRFALVQVGLELAHSQGLLPFCIEQCAWAVRKMFTAWVNVRGGEGSIEIKEACNKIELLFESNQHGDRIYEIGKDSSSHQIVRNLLAYKVYDVLTQTVEFLVPVPVFNKEMAEGIDRSQLIARLHELGHLKISTAIDRNTVKRTILGKKRSFFAFREFWIEPEEEKVPQKEDGFGNDEKPTGLTGLPSETNSGRLFEESRNPQDDENSNGTTRLEVNPITASSPVSPIEENSTELERDSLEPSSEAGLDTLVPLVPLVPLKKHVTQNIPKKVTRFKVGDRVRYMGKVANLLKQYSGELEVYEVSGDTYSCLKPDRTLTSWIEFADLELVMS